MNTELINRILERAEGKCFGVNVIPIDRLHKGTKEEIRFYKLLIQSWKERTEALDIAAFTMQTMDAELRDLRESVKASGLLSMGMGAKRDPAKDQQ